MPLNCWSYCSCFLPGQRRLRADKKVPDLSPKAAKASVHLGWEASLLADKPGSLWRSGFWQLGLLQGEKQPAFLAGRAVNKAAGA